MRFVISFSLAAVSALYATVPNIGDVVRETASPQQNMTPTSDPMVEISGVEKYTPAMKDDKSNKTIKVNRFNISGAHQLDDKTLQALITSYIDKELTFGQLQEVTSIITKAYRSKGYFVARAYIPMQKMVNNTVEITVIEGYYGDFKLNNTSLVQDSIIKGLLDDVKEDKIVSTHTLERAMLIINDTPGIKVTQADVMPGTLIGSSDFAIKAEPTKRAEGYIAGDNYGSRYTGNNRLMGGLNLNSPFGIGDRVSINGMISNGSDLKFAKFAYNAPLMANGLRGEISYSAVNYHLTDQYESMDAYGKARGFEASLTYPIIRTRAETLKLVSGITSKDLRDYQSDTLITDKSITSFNLGLTHETFHHLFGFNTYLKEGVTLTAGNLKFADDTSRASDAAGANTQGRYNLINAHLGATVTLTPQSSLETTLKLQKSLKNKNLDGSEDFSIGGSSGVKVYPYSELSAENGIMFSTQFFQKLLPMYHINQKLGLFYDIGKVSMADSSKVTTFESRTLQDAGIGYYASSDPFFASIQLAYIIGGGHVTSEPDYNSKLLLQLGWNF